MTRRHFVRLLAAGICGVPLLKVIPKKPEPFRTATSFVWFEDDGLFWCTSPRLPDQHFLTLQSLQAAYEKARRVCPRM